MAHGLSKFRAQELIDKARSAADIIEHAAASGKQAEAEALMEALLIALENQAAIAETLDLIKQEFDKFEEGLSKIL